MERRLRRGIDRFPGWLQRLVEIGAVPSDSEELRVRKAVLVLSATLMASLSFVWVVTYASLGLWVSAAIPFVYQLASAASIYAFARTRRYALFRESQLLMSLVFPFVLQWSLGGFEASSAVCLWGITSPLGALLFVGARQSVPWFVAFAGLVGVLRRDRPGAVRRRARHPATASSSRSSRSTSSAWRRPPTRCCSTSSARGSRRCGARAASTGARARAGQVRAPAAQRPSRAGRRAPQGAARASSPTTSRP